MTVWKREGLSLVTGKAVAVRKTVRTRLDVDADRYAEFLKAHAKDFNLSHYASPFDVEWGKWEPGMRKSGHWFF